jgi:hypothetical protein
MSNFAIYMIGSILVAGGIAFAAFQLGLGATWIWIIAAIIIGFGIMGGIKKTRKQEHSDAEG